MTHAGGNQQEMNEMLGEVQVKTVLFGEGKEIALTLRKGQAASKNDSPIAPEREKGKEKRCHMERPERGKIGATNARDSKIKRGDGLQAEGSRKTSDMRKNERRGKKKVGKDESDRSTSKAKRHAQTRLTSEKKGGKGRIHVEQNRREMAKPSRWDKIPDAKKKNEMGENFTENKVFTR